MIERWHEEALLKYWPVWQQKRIDFLVNRFGERFWRKKLILETGPCNGNIGAFFAELGAHVVCVEGRKDNAQFIIKHHPSLHVFICDLDRPEWNLGRYDVILHLGTLYHLNHHHAAHLQNCLDHTDLLILETEVYDSPDPEIFYRDESGFDQALDGRGGVPSCAYIEKILKGCDYELICDPALDSENYNYSWKSTNNRQPDPNKRRLFLIDSR